MPTEHRLKELQQSMSEISEKKQTIGDELPDRNITKSTHKIVEIPQVLNAQHELRAYLSDRVQGGRSNTSFRSIA